MWIPFTVSIFCSRNSHLLWKDSLDEVKHVSYYHRSQVFIAPFFFIGLDVITYKENISNSKVEIILDQGQ